MAALQHLDNKTSKSMKRIVSKIGLVCFIFIVASLFVLASCSSSKKTATRKGDASVAANVPDYKQIKKEINSKDSEFYYPELLRRFQAADTTLSLEQVRHFYYGAATMPEYNPYRFSLLGELNEALEKGELQKADSIIERQLADDPTNLQFYEYKMMLKTEQFGRDSKEANDAFFQVFMLSSAILSSGDGLSKETAIYVINIADEYAIMTLYGLSLKMQSLIMVDGQKLDQMDLVSNKYGWKTLYFNTSITETALKNLF